MAEYPTGPDDVRVGPDVLTETTTSIFSACGMSDDDARLLAESLVHADLRGIHSHGVLRVPDYVEKLTREGVDPRGTPRLASDRGAALVVDGGNSMGQIGLGFAMRAAIERAGEIGVAFAAVGNSNHCGTMHYFVSMAVERGLIGLAGTNALPTMAPWGGTDKVVGINPLGIGIPGGGEGDFILDIAFGQTAHGKIRVYAQKGAPIPGNWAFDADGEPTTDALAALSGLIRPIGDHKGVGMGMAVGMLSTLLSGAGYGTRSGNMVDGPLAGRDGHFCCVVDPEFFTGAGAMRKSVDEILVEIRTSRKATDTQRLLTPGELEEDFARRYAVEGIPLNRETLAGIRDAARDIGVDASNLIGSAGR